MHFLLAYFLKNPRLSVICYLLTDFPVNALIYQMKTRKVAVLFSLSEIRMIVVVFEAITPQAFTKCTYSERLDETR